MRNGIIVRIGIAGNSSDIVRNLESSTNGGVNSDSFHAVEVQRQRSNVGDTTLGAGRISTDGDIILSIAGACGVEAQTSATVTEGPECKFRNQRLTIHRDNRNMEILLLAERNGLLGVIIGCTIHIETDDRFRIDIDINHRVIRTTGQLVGDRKDVVTTVRHHVVDEDVDTLVVRILRI